MPLLLRTQPIARLILAVALTAAWTGCATLPEAKLHNGLKAYWAEYEQLPRVKAMAVAGDPDRAWVAGSAGGASGWEEAEQLAMEECNKRRHARRMTIRG